MKKSPEVRLPVTTLDTGVSARRQIIAKNRDRLRVDHYRTRLNLWEGNERSEQRGAIIPFVDEKEEQSGDEGRGRIEGELGRNLGGRRAREIKRGKKGNPQYARNKL